MEHAMRVLWVGHFPPFPPKGGASQRSFNMLKEVARFSQVDFVALAPKSRVLSYYSIYEDGLRDIERNLARYCHEVELVEYGLKSRKFNKIVQAAKSLFTLSPYDEISLRSSEFAQRVDALLATNHYDIIYLDTLGLCQYLPSGVREKVILNHHNIESDMLSRRSQLAGGALLKRYFASQATKTVRLERRVTKQVSVNLVCSSLDKQRLAQISSCKVEVVPNGVDTHYFNRKEPYAPDKVKGSIFAGGLDWYPNAAAVEFIVQEIVPVLGGSSQGYPITICGKGSNKSLERAASNSPNVVAAGFVPDIRTYLESAALYLCPINDGGGTKLKVLDALAMGVPLIASSTACEGIEVQEGVHVVYAETPRDYQEAIDQLMSSPRKRVEMSEHGRMLIEKQYSYGVIGKRIEAIFHSLADVGAGAQSQVDVAGRDYA